jgi:hypothetical protein
MDEYGKNPAPLFVSSQSLSCPGLSLDHAVDDFKMTWVWGQMNAHFAPICRFPDGLIAQMVLYVAASMSGVGNEIFRKLPKDEFMGFA